MLTLLAILLSLATGERTANWLFDAWQRASPRNLSGSDVRVVMIDGESLRTVGPWPWPRYYMARLTEEIAAGGADVIGFDMVFPEPDRVRPDLFVRFYPEMSRESAQEVAALPPMDQLFGRVIGQWPVVLARAGSGPDAATGQAAAADAPITGSLPAAIDSWPNIISSIPEIDETALGHGLINGRPDSDGVVRSIPMLGRVNGQAMPGLALEIARIRMGAEEVATSSSWVRIGTRSIPVDERGRMRLHFGRFPPSSILSAERVLGRGVPRNYFRDKTVLIGLGAEGTADIVATPMAGEEFGLLVQAEAVDAILDQGWLKRPAWTEWVEWLAGLLLAGLILVLAHRSWRAWSLPILGIAALPVISLILFRAESILFDPVRPGLVGGAALAGVAIGLFGEARRERERLRDELVQERVAAAAAEGELRAARDIQLGMVPPRDGLAGIDPRLDVDALLEPARSVGGDLYDCIRIGPDKVGFAIGDVTGKGVPAALFMAMSKALLSSALCRERGALSAAIDAINRDLMRSNEEMMSVTMIVGEIDLRSGIVSLVCAGHEDPYVVRSDGSIRRIGLEGGPPLGMVEYDYPVETMTLGKGDALALVTDGITEAQDASGTLYGRDRIARRLAAAAPSARGICEAVRDDVRDFEGHEDPTDDLTVLVIRYAGTSV